MSVIGFDIGNETCVIAAAAAAAAKGKGVDVLLNNESKHETPAVVSFGEKQRYLGSAGAAFATTNPKSTVSQIKRLIGRLYKEVEEDLKLLPYTTREGPRGGILIELEYLKTKWTFTPVEILAMLLKHLKQLTEKKLETSVVDCVIGIPSYFSDLQRRLYLDAAFLAGLKPLRLMHDGTAIALGYGIYNTDFFNSGPINVMFVDIGHCDTQVTLAAFEQGSMKILSHSFDQNLGGRDFDEVLFNHFAAQFYEKFKIDVKSNAGASARLRASCEKVKKVLSANAEAPLSIECLIGDTDVRGIITREEFEKLSSKLLERVIVPCNKALKYCGLSVDQIHTIELVGSGSHIPAITKYITLFFEKETTRTLNASECVARGCALRCAMLSPSLKVRDYKIEDSFPYSVVIPTPEGEVKLFPKGSSFPNEKILHHVEKNHFYIQVAYRKERDFPAGISHIVGHFGIGSDEPSIAEKVNVDFKVKLNYDGIIELDSATIVEDKRSFDLRTLFSGSNMVPTTRMLSLPITENLEVSTTNEELDAAKENEKMLTEQEMRVEETKDQRNTLESFVYDTRSKLLEPIENKYNEEIATEKAKKALQDCFAKYHSRADWLPADQKEKNLEMSMIGFDIGNESCVIAAAKGKGVDVLWDNEWKRETPAVVVFGERRRYLGSIGASFATANPKSTVSQIKRLIGKLYKEVEEDLKLLPFATSEGPRGGILIELEYLKKNWSFTPVEILGMLFKHLKQITERNLESSVAECVIGIPSYFTDLQRRLYLDAAFLAGLKPLRLLHDGTAIALGYGIYKLDVSNSGPANVMFVDIGHCDTQVTVAAFEHEKMKILSHSFDQNLGGRDFDEVLFKHFAVQFNEKYKIDVHSNARASKRLRESCEKLKKVLSTNAEAPLSIDCLIGDIDVSGLITREEFENLSSKLLEKVIVACIMALEDSDLSVDKIYTIELVGSGSRIPAISRILTSFFEKKPTRRLNASECVAIGCALHCSMLSPTSVVGDYKVEDAFPYSVVIPIPEGEVKLFSKGSSFPDEKILHNNKIPFYIQVAYKKVKDFPAGISHVVGHFGIGSDESSDAEKVKVEFRMKLNDNGIVEIHSATILDDKPYSAGNLPISENLDVATTNDELHEAKEKEKMLEEHEIKAEAKDPINALESFINDTRSKLSSAYRSFATDSEKEVIIKNLRVTEHWLYEESDDESDPDYMGKLEDLKKLIEPVENRYEENARAEATKALQTCIANYQSLADSLPADKKDKVINVCTETEQWLSGLSQKHSSPLTLSTDINRTIENFENDCESIIRSKSIYSWLEIPMDSDQKDQPVDSEKATKEEKALEKCIVKYRLHSETLSAGMKAKVYNVFMKAEEQFLNAVSQKHSSPKTLATEIIHITKFVESDCERIIRSKSSYLWPEESNQRYQASDSEIARRKATKALQTCIAEHRLNAESLTPDKKEKVLIECNRAELQLKQSSSNTMATHFTQLTEKLKSNCQSIIISNPTFQRHEKSYQREETSDSESDRTKATTAFQTCIADYRLHAISLTADKKEMVLNECNVAEVWLNQSSTNTMTTNIIEVLENFKSNCESIIRPNPSLPRHENLYQRNKTMDSENVRTEATNFLQTCITEHRLKAESLTPEKKEKVLNVCNVAEVWLYQSSPNAMTTTIIEVIEQFKRHANTYQRDETRDFENAKTEATKALRTCIAENRLQADSLTADKKEMVCYECNRAEVWLTGLFQKQLSPNDITQIINAKKHLESFCESIIISKPSFPWNEQPKE